MSWFQFKYILKKCFFKNRICGSLRPSAGGFSLHQAKWTQQSRAQGLAVPAAKTRGTATEAVHRYERQWTVRRAADSRPYGRRALNRRARRPCRAVFDSSAKQTPQSFILSS